MTFEIAPKSTEIEANWEDAKLYCFSLKVDGKVGWRLPTREELNAIYQSESDFEKSYYWSSTELNGYHAWTQYFGDGGRSYNGKDYGGFYVRAIRDLKDN
jgi:hypothetical protein